MEHLHHFGLSQDPFSNEPDLRFYFESASHLDAQRRVDRALRQRKGLTLLTGEMGMGKTLVARRVLDALEEEVFEATLLVMLAGAADATSILQRFARQLGADEPAGDRAGLLGQIYEHLAIVREDGRHAVLMIDDAQVMTPEVLSELSGLLNLEYEDRRLLSMMLIGSPKLDPRVQGDASMAPRVEVRVELQPLDAAHSAAYVAHRLKSVGGRVDLIPGVAMETLFKCGGGRPRLMNTLADNALFESYLAGRTVIEPSDVERAAADLGITANAGTSFTSQAPAPSPVVMPTTPVPASPPASSEVSAPFEQGPAAAPIIDTLPPPSAADPFGTPLDEVGSPLSDPLDDLSLVGPLGSADPLDLSLDLSTAPASAEPIELTLEETDLLGGSGEPLDDAYVELIEE